MPVLFVAQEQEQEQEQEKEEIVMDDDPEEFVRMKYARDDEAIRPWAIRDLARPLVSNLGFYPASEFGVLTKLIQQVFFRSCLCWFWKYSRFFFIIFGCAFVFSRSFSRNVWFSPVVDVPSFVLPKVESRQQIRISAASVYCYGRLAKVGPWRLLR